MKMYILIKDDIPIGNAIVAAAHASLMIYFRYKYDIDMENWSHESFVKVICKVTNEEFEMAKKQEGYCVVTESTLDNKEVALAFRPREVWDKSFRYYKLYK
jgi:peptidyl-tRNA hydrolase